MNIIENLIGKNGLVFAFLFVGTLMWISFWFSKAVTKNKIPGVAIAILAGLGLAFFGGKKGLSDIPVFAGLALLGGSMLRDFAVVATGLGVEVKSIRKAGVAGVLSLLVGISYTFFVAAFLAYLMGYKDAVSITTIAAGACTYIIGPVTGAALGASSGVIAISIAAGVIKTIIVTIFTPIIAPYINLNNNRSAMVFGGLLGTTSGVSAGLAATDPKLIPYGALTATFYTGLGCLLCPSVFFLLIRFIVS